MSPGRPTLAQRERSALVESMRATGPDAPTLCEGWTTRDLAAHLVVREYRPDAAAGIVVPALADRMEHLRLREAERPWEDLLDTITTGVRSSFTYAGAPTADEFRDRAVIGLQSAAGYAEGRPVASS